MAYSMEVVKRARDRLAQAKEDRESENRQHLAEAYARLPRLREIDIQLRRTMAQAAQAAFLQGSDGKELLEQARQNNLELQRERQRLVDTHFEEGFLDESPICAHCGGSGYVGSNMCECLKELCRQEQKREISVLAGNRDNFSQFRLEYYSDQLDPKLGVSPRMMMEKNLKICREYALWFSGSNGNSGNLLFMGGTGLGKTFLSACIARTVADRGYSVVYESASHMFAKMERVKFNNDQELRKEVENYEKCDLLILDDLGTEMPGQFVTAALYSLLNDRLMAGLPMVISTNLNADELSRRYSPQIASRLLGSFNCRRFEGEDIRRIKNRGL